jgi:hydrogenase large subunit
MGKIIIDPVNRMEGHIGIDASITNAESGGFRIVANGAKIKGNMFRGFEILLKQRDPRDALVITQRHCGVCPIGHGTASSMNIGTAFKYQVHYEDKLPKLQRPLKGWTSKSLPANAAPFRNIIHVANHLMSHILHFYHLAALDYVKPVAWNVGGSGVFTPLTRPFLAPRYDDNYYINTARVLAVAGLLPPAAVTTLSTLPGWGVDPGDAINNYLTGQYLRALNIRRMCHEIQGIFGGRAPHASGFTPGGATSNTSQADIDKSREILYEGGVGGTPSAPAPGTVMAFVGDPLDFALGKAGTMMFDVVAAAHLFPEYFWIGNAWGNFMSYGWGEEAGTIHYSDSVYGGLLFPGGKTNPDQRTSRRGWYAGGANGCIPPINVQSVNIMNVGESVQTGSKYKPYAGFKHPWTGVTKPDPEQIANPNGYSWLKAPRYNTGAGYQVFEVGPLSRMVVDGCYFAGILNVAGYGVTPLAGAPGPDCATGADPIGAALKPVYANIPPARAGGPNLSGVAYNGDSVLDRIATRALECRMMCDQAKHFLDQIEGTVSGGYATTGITDDTIPMQTTVKKGYGMTEASRGALSHWIKYKNGKITLYQAVVPTTWNASPRDANGNPGPAEQSLMSGGGLWVADPSQAIECIRVTHSYDFCIACAVHLITPKGDVVKVDVPALPG